MEIVKNERSWAIQLITKINIILQNKSWRIKSAGGETTINTGKNRMFPDVILYGDKSQIDILQGWEIKMPDVPITDRDFIKDAERKARTLKLNSFILWNFKNVDLYILNDETNKFEKARSWDDTDYIKKRIDVEYYEEDWLELLKEVLLYVNEFLIRGVIKNQNISKNITNNIISNFISKNKYLLSEELRRESKSNMEISYNLNFWWKNIKEEYLLDEKTMYNAYSKVILMNWINKFIFANVIKKHHNPAYLVESIDINTSPKKALYIFDKISQECDFYNIFSKIEYSEILPEDVWENLIELNNFLISTSIDKLNQDMFQKVLEQSVSQSKREIIGQYTTPKKLAELLVKLTIKDLKGNCIDPCCGTGTISKEILNYKKEYLSISESIETVWSSDKYSFPLQIVGLNLTDYKSINKPMRVFKENAFNLKKGKTIKITNPEDGNKIQLELPKFKNIVSNLPFINFNKELEEDIQTLERVENKIKEETGIKMNKRNDMYSYLIIDLWDVLEDEGRIGIIVSNSWLGTTAGRNFYEILQKYYKIESVLISGVEKWFKNADVVTTILILQKDKNINNNYKTSYCVLEKKLEDLNGKEMNELISDYYKIQKNDFIDSKYLTVNSYSQERVKEILDMNVSLNTLFHHVDWILDINSKLVKLKDVFSVFRGEKTGQDEIFYLEDTEVVDKEFIIKGLKNTKQCETLIYEPDTNVFMCNLNKDELQSGKFKKTLRWINRFENNLNISVKNKGVNWHKLNDDKLALFFTGMNPDKRLFFGRFKEYSFINQRVIGLNPISKDIDIELEHALLNSILSLFYLEAIGFGRGLGALDFNKNNLEGINILNSDLLSKDSKNEIKKAFKPLLNREILPVIDELNAKDRKKFDMVVLKSFGLEKYYEKIKRSVISLHNVRLIVKK